MINWNVDLAVRLSKEGKSLAEISEECGVTRQRVQQVLAARGIHTQRKAGRPAAEKFHKNVRFFERQGLSCADIARRLRKTGESFENAYARVHHSLHRKDK